jgi:hypothetical protein
MKRNSTLCLVIAMFGLSLPSTAEVVLASYDFESGYASGTTDPNVTASNFSPNAGAGLSGTTREASSIDGNPVTGSGNVWKVAGNDTSGSEDVDNTFEAKMDVAITRNNYATFTVTIPADVTFNITSLSYDWGVNGSYETGMGFFTDKTGFTAGSQALGGSYEASVGSLNYANNGQSIDLSGITALQGLTNTTVEFRVYAHDRSGSDTRWQELDNLVISGNVVPVSGSSDVRLSVTHDATTNELTFTWNSQSGKLYDLLSSTTLDTPPSSPWPVYDDGVTVTTDLTPDGSGTNTLVVPRPADAARFFSIREKD